METQQLPSVKEVLAWPELRVQRVIRHAGGGIRWVYHRTILYSFGIAVALHLAAIFAYIASHPDDERRLAFKSLPALPVPHGAHYIAIDMRHVTVINPGGGGGSHDIDAPVGRAKSGDPGARPKIEPSAVSPQARAFVPKVPAHPRPSARSSEARSDASVRDTAQSVSSGEGLRGQHADGKGIADAGGSGGRGIGHGVGIGIGNGEGIGSRGWLRPPSRTAIEGLEVAGSVRLAFTVMPNGEITNIVPVKKANPTLLAEAIRRLNGAKVKPLPSSVPQLTVRWALTFNFELR